MKKFLSLYVCTVFFLCLLQAEEISKYDIDITIQTNGSLSIKERIEYDFKEDKKHGMFRDIPISIKQDWHTIDLGLANYSVKMDGKSVEWKESIMYSHTIGEFVRLKIGSPSTYLSGKHIYEIDYSVKLGVLVSAQDTRKDAIRWNIIGTGWEIPLSNIKARFILPLALSEDHVETATYTGEYGSTDTKAISKWINSHTFEVSVPSLKAYEGATVEIAYTADILGQSGKINEQPSVEDRLIAHWHWGALLGILLYLKILFRRYSGFSDKRSIAVQYHPPKDLSLLQSGLLLDKVADNKDFSAAILELAYLGYIIIEQKNQETDPILIRSDKQIENLSEDQKYLLDSTLFEKENRFLLSAGVKEKADGLKSDFSKINTFLYDWSVYKEYMAESPKVSRKKFLKKSILALLPVLTLVAYSLFSILGDNAIFIFIFPLVFGVSGMAVILSTKVWGLRLFGLLFVITGLMPLWIMGEKSMSLESLIFGPVGVLFVLLMVVMILYQKIGRFTQKGAYLNTQLLGLKIYIQRVKEDEINRQLARDPLYLEKLLPYAILFNEVKHWLSFYERLHLSTPSWYKGSSYNLEHFSSSVSNASTPPMESTRSSGYSGSGGSSGGGGGGGGGGSW